MTINDNRRSLAGRALNRLRLMLAGRVAARRLRERARQVYGIDEAIDLADWFRHGAFDIRPWQARPEITALLERLREHRPHRILEIGSARGGTLFLFTRVAPDDALLVSVDLPGGPFGGAYDKAAAPLLRSFARARQRVELIRGDSRDLKTVERVRRVLAGEQLDFLFIDGDHSYDGVRADYETYSPFVREGGLIAFHDIVPGDPELVGGVPQFWAELKPGREIFEFVRDWDQGGLGIGVVVQNGSSTAEPVPSA
jgi:cephalosporin hydroxylase